MRRHNKYSAVSGRFGFCQMMLSAVLLVGWSASAQSSIWLDGTVATMQALDKITARISTLAAPVGELRQFGTLEVTVQRCVFHPPEETPENAAFVVIRDLGYDPSAPPTDVFSGWMFSSSPAISALEHPVYDITILACNPD
jgi:hypothetical protein